MKNFSRFKYLQPIAYPMVYGNDFSGSAKYYGKINENY